MLGRSLLAPSALVLLLLSSSLSCKKPASDDAPGIMLADTGFRPAKNGYKFENQGGQYPRTPGVLGPAGVAKMFGKDACVSGDGATCKLTPVAGEWMGTVNRAMNMGQCEGMAVSSATFFQKLYNPTSFAPGATSIHDLTHAQAGPLIGYYWALQMTNPVRSQKIMSLLTLTPNTAEDTVVAMLKRNEYATIAIRSPQGGHAVTPYAVEDRGNGIHWIDIYDNNWPDRARHIIIDRNANTWKYELASLNPDVPKEPWAGTADSHTIAVVPISVRLTKPDCPFCTGSKKMVMASGANGVLISNGQGQKVGRDGDKVVNEIPGAEVVDIASFIDGTPATEPAYVVPSEGDYDVAIVGQDKKAAPGGSDEDHGVAVIGNGTAVTVETPKLKTNEKDVLSLSHEGGIKYRTGSGGSFPPIRLAADGPGGGMHARLSNMKAEANDQLSLKMDHAAGNITVEGGGKRSDSFDLKVTHVKAGEEDHVNEQKAIPFHAGESHTIQSSATPAKGGSPFTVTHTAVSTKAAPGASTAGAAPQATGSHGTKAVPSATTHAAATGAPKSTAPRPSTTAPRKH